MSDNIVLQIEELEVLSSIFGDQWKCSTKVNNMYSINISDDVELWITLNENYPTSSPPAYDVVAPALSGAQRKLISESFKELYDNNTGSPVIYQWIEKLKEIVNGDSLHADTEKGIENVQSDGQLNGQREEVIQQESKKMEIFHGEPFTERRSTFQAHASKVTSLAQVEEFRRQLFEHRKIAHAEHNILAYRICVNNDLLEDFDDDGEHSAGNRLLNVLRMLDVKNCAVLVTRWFGGILLGPDRFRLINNVAQQLLTRAGFTKSDV